MQIRGVLTALVAATILVVPATSHARSACRGADAPAGVATERTAASAVRCLVNRERRRRGLAPLSGERRLRRAASGLAHAMVARRFFGHVTPGGRTLLDRVRGTRYLTPRLRAFAIGENLGRGRDGRSTPHAIVRGWMRSAVHRANVLDPRFRHIGVAAADGSPVGDGQTRTFVADFGLRVTR